MRFEIVETDLEGTSLNQIRKPTWSKDGTVVDVAIIKASGHAFEDTRVDTEDIKGHHGLVFP